MPGTRKLETPGWNPGSATQQLWHPEQITCLLHLGLSLPYLGIMYLKGLAGTDEQKNGCNYYQNDISLNWSGPNY